MRKILSALALLVLLGPLTLAADVNGPKSAAVTHTNEQIKLDGALSARLVREW